MTKHIPKIIYIIFLIALILRIWKLDIFPMGFHSDEARVAWNSYSILKTGSDDRGNILSLYYNTFGDYRPTGIFYITIPSLLIFGQTEFAVRFPSALIGAFTVFPLFLLIREITKNERLARNAGLLLTFSPWHFEVSRATSEVVISTFFILYSLYFLVRAIKHENKREYILSGSFILISFLFYHSIRLLAPLLFLTIIVYYIKNEGLKILTKQLLLLFIFVLSLTLIFSFTSEARQRLSQVSLIQDENTLYEIERLQSERPNRSLLEQLITSRYSIYIKRFIIEYSSYFNGNFLLGEFARPYRYTTPGVGLLTLSEFILFTVGIIYLVKPKRNRLPIFFLLIAPLPAALTTEDAPNLHRAFLMVPFIVIIEAYGFLAISKIKPYSVVLKYPFYIFLFFSFLVFLYRYFFYSYSHMPFIKNYSLDGSSYRNIMTKELVLEVENIRSKYDKVIFTNSTDDPYPWYAFFTKKDPKEFNTFAIKRTNGPWEYENIVFSQSKCPSSSYFKSEAGTILVIDASAPICAYDSQIKDGQPIKVTKKLFRPDGSEVFVFLERKI